MIRAGQADRRADPAFPGIDLFAWGVERDVGDYGPNASAVAAIIERAEKLDSLAVERVGSVWARGNEGRSADRASELAVRAAILAAAETTDMRDAVRAAFLDGQLAILVACNPMALALEHWWNNYPEVPAMHAAGYLAAATVVANRIDPEVLEIAGRPFTALADGLPAGLFGPQHDGVIAIIDAVSELVRPQARRIEAVWSREPMGNLDQFGYPGPLDPGRGVDGWMPRRKGRRHHAWIALLERAHPTVRANRHFEWATTTAAMRTRSNGTTGITRSLAGAVRAAVAATLFSDLADPSLVADLTEAWRSRDHDVEPSTWWATRRAGPGGLRGRG